MQNLAPNLDMIITAIILVAVFYCFVKEVFPAHITAMTALAALIATGVISTESALAVFSNPAPITIACMFILSAALQKTGVIDFMGFGILKVAEFNKSLAIFLLLGGVAVASAFMNNTPIVIIMAPVMINLAQKFNDYPSKYLIPLSYIAILGGACTLIGTSTNILVDGVARANGQPAFSMFEISGAGIIFALVGAAFMVTIGRRFLPERELVESEFIKEARNKRFLAEAFITSDSSVIGKTLNDIRFTPNGDYEIIDLIRNNEGNRLRSALLKALTSAVKTSTSSTLKDLPLKAGDKIIFKASKEEFDELHKLSGINFGGQESKEDLSAKETEIEEAVIGQNSDFIGKRPADLGLRRRYGCYIMAIHRDKTNITKNFDDVRFKQGDTVIIEGGKDDLERLFKNEEIIAVSKFRYSNLNMKKAPIAITAIVCVVALSALNLMPIAGIALIASMVVILTKCVDSEQVYDSVEWKMLMIIFGSISLSIAMQDSGLAKFIIDKIAFWSKDLGPVAILAILYLITSIMTEVISNNAAAVLLTPIAIGLAHLFGVDPRPFIVAVMFGASASFATPIGYQTNTYVYNIGNYRFSDFLRVGVIMNLLMLAVAVIVIPIFWSF